MDKASDGPSMEQEKGAASAASRAMPVIVQLLEKRYVASLLLLCSAIAVFVMIGIDDVRRDYQSMHQAMEDTIQTKAQNAVHILAHEFHAIVDMVHQAEKMLLLDSEELSIEISPVVSERFYDQITSLHLPVTGMAIYRPDGSKLSENKKGISLPKQCTDCLAFRSGDGFFYGWHLVSAQAMPVDFHKAGTDKVFYLIKEISSVEGIIGPSVVIAIDIAQIDIGHLVGLTSNAGLALVMRPSNILHLESQSKSVEKYLKEIQVNELYRQCPKIDLGDHDSFFDHHPASCVVSDGAIITHILPITGTSLMIYFGTDTKDFYDGFWPQYYGANVYRILAVIILSILALLSVRQYLARLNADRALIRANDELENRVRNRTLELRQEIVERKRAETNLQLERHFANGVFETAPALVTVLDLDGNVVRWNKLCEKLTGLGEHQVLKTNPWKTLSDNWEQAQFLSRLSETVHSGETTYFEGCWLGLDGRDIYIAWSLGALRNNDDLVSHVIMSGIDITERREMELALRTSEARFQAFMSHVPAGTFLKQGDRYVYANEFFAGLVAVPVSELLEKADAEIFDDDLAQKLTALCKEAPRRGPSKTTELEIVCDGSKRIILAIAFQVLSAGLDEPVVGAVLLDVTAHRQARNELIHAQKLESLGRLTSGVAHDFNNLLTVITGNLEMLETALQNDETSLALVEECQDAAKRGAFVADRLLALSRPGPQKKVLLNPVAVLEPMTVLLRRILGDTIELKADLSVARGGNYLIVVDRQQLESTLLNLVINARDAMPGGGKVAMTLNPVKSQGDEKRFGNVQELCLSVTDSGAGISADNLAHVFAPFFTTKDREKGTGLGLSMAKSFAEQSGGRIEINSLVGHGTTIRVFLPVAKYDDHDTGADLPSASHAESL